MRGLKLPLIFLLTLLAGAVEAQEKYFSVNPVLQNLRQ